MHWPYGPGIMSVVCGLWNFLILAVTVVHQVDIIIELCFHVEETCILRCGLAVGRLVSRRTTVLSSNETQKMQNGQR